MSWGQELVKIRRFLRDPDGNIWTEATLRHIYNDVQQDFQHRTNLLEDAIALRVPQLYHWAYMHDWEYAYLPGDKSQFYQCLARHDDGVVCHVWEVQQRAAIAADVADQGAHFTQPWEGFHLSPGEVIKMRFPQNFRSVKFIAWDECRIAAATKRGIQSADRGWITREGEPFAYYPLDEVDNSFVLYPKPPDSTAFADDIEGEGMAFYESGDSEDDTTGLIAVRDGSTPSESVGGSMDVIDVENNVFLVYSITPDDMLTVSSESDFPPFVQKYIRHGTLARAFGANTDGKNPALAEYWGIRYGVGVALMKRYKGQRSSADKVMRLKTHSPTSRPRSRRGPRLPDRYPAV